MTPTRSAEARATLDRLFARLETETAKRRDPRHPLHKLETAEFYMHTAASFRMYQAEYSRREQSEYRTASAQTSWELTALWNAAAAEAERLEAEAVRKALEAHRRTFTRGNRENAINRTNYAHRIYNCTAFSTPDRLREQKTAIEQAIYAARLYR